MRHVANFYCRRPLDVLCTLQTSALASLPVHVFLIPTHTILTNDHYLCSLPAADAELLQHSPDSALREGLLCFKDLLHVIQTLFLLGQKHNFVLNCLLSQQPDKMSCRSDQELLFELKSWNSLQLPFGQHDEGVGKTLPDKTATTAACKLILF